MFVDCEQFVAVKVNAALKNFTVCLKDRRVPQCSCVLRLQLNNLSANFKQRPSANAMRYKPSSNPVRSHVEL